ncbi:MAG: hypothetical protein JWO82_1878 [Akkermansiaceae bacterium]|nr:hypothetical protein [Akkermansiaceae bacterium]
MVLAVADSVLLICGFSFDAGSWGWGDIFGILSAAIIGSAVAFNLYMWPRLGAGNHQILSVLAPILIIQVIRDALKREDWPWVITILWVLLFVGVHMASIKLSKPAAAPGQGKSA